MPLCGGWLCGCCFFRHHEANETKPWANSDRFGFSGGFWFGRPWHVIIRFQSRLFMFKDFLVQILLALFLSLQPTVLA